VTQKPHVEDSVDGIHEKLAKTEPRDKTWEEVVQANLTIGSTTNSPTFESSGQQPRSYLDHAAHGATSMLAQLTLGETEQESQSHTDFEKYSKMFAMAVPLFLSRKGAVSLTVGMYALNEARPEDSIQTQIGDGLLGGAKGLALKGTLKGMSAINGSPAMKGMAMGFVDRSAQTALTRQNWIDPRTGEVSGQRAVLNTIHEAANPRALALDAVLFGGTEFTVGKLNYATKGAFYRNPALPTVASGAIFGAATGASEEVSRQSKNGESFDLSKVLYRSGLSSAVTASAASIGALDRAKSLRIENHDAHTVFDTKAPIPDVVTKFNTHDIRQIELKSSPLTVKRQLNDIAFLGEVKVPSGDVKQVIFRLTETPEMRARFANEMLDYRLHRALKPGTESRTIVEAEASINSQKRPGYIQELRGGSLEDGLRSMSMAREGMVTDRAAARSLSKDPFLFNQYEKLWVERMLMQEWDSHAHNMLMGPGKKLSNIDFDAAMPPAKYKSDYVPTWGKTASIVSLLNDRLIGQFSGKPLSPDSRRMVSDFVTDFNTPAGRQALGGAGHSIAQVDGLIGRARWFADTGKMPTRDTPNLFIQTTLRALYLMRKGQSPRFEKEPGLKEAH